MHAKAAALLDAHVDHLLQQVSDEKLEATLHREVGPVLDWLAARPVNSLVDVSRVQAIAQERVLAQPLSEELLAQLATLIKAALDSELNSKTYVHQLLEHQHYTRIVENIANREKLRQDLIHAIVGNPMYAKLLSDVIYHALSDYMVQNPLTKNVPGMSSLMKMGKGLVESAGSGAIKGYLQKNIQNLVGLSEKVINSSLNNHQIHQVAEHVWHQIKGQPLSVSRKYVQDADIDLIGKISADLWNHFRRTEYAQQIVNELIAVWFKHYGQKSAMDLLAMLNVSRDTLLAEVHLSARKIVNELRESGFLAERVRLQLAEFYSLDAVAAILG